MSNLENYNPLLEIKIPGVTNPVETKGLIIIVGPNSSGKTLLLKDIENKLTGVEQKFVVAQEMLLEKPTDFTLYINRLIEQKMIEKRGEKLKIASPHFGKGMRDDADHQMEGLVNLGQTFNNGWATGGKVDFFQVLGRLLLTSLFLENRLSLYAAQGRFDQYNQGPQNDLQALFLNSDAQDELEAETGKVFRNVAWLDTVTRFNQFLLRISGAAEPPSPKASGNFGQSCEDRGFAYWRRSSYGILRAAFSLTARRADDDRDRTHHAR